VRHRRPTANDFDGRSTAFPAVAGMGKDNVPYTLKPRPRLLGGWRVPVDVALKNGAKICGGFGGFKYAVGPGFSLTLELAEIFISEVRPVVVN
jgi:hypothetical protein